MSLDYWKGTTRLRSSNCALAMVVVLYIIFAALSAHAQVLTVLYSFQGGTDGEFPAARLSRDAAGNLYGTTSDGGASGSGTVFRLDTNGVESVLYSFTGSPDGSAPLAGLGLDAMGNLYGTTANGGASHTGTVFKLDITGKETVLHSFAGAPTDGSKPLAGLIRDKAGNLYGTTAFTGPFFNGTVYKLDTTGKEILLYSFLGEPDGCLPAAGLVRDEAGNLYGTTEYGGAFNNGTVFKLDAAGNETVLHSFAGGQDGYTPAAGLVPDEAGNLYGTTEGGGAFGVFGTVFKLDATGNLTVLHSFGGAPTDGEFPLAGLIRDKAGNLYGTTEVGGAFNNGTVFKVDSTGKETVLHSFAGSPSDGGFPQGGLILDKAGNLYGTTGKGGASNLGTIFKLSPN
jgi:uncharacterized repeat protein (TIGR03803 family)